MNISKKIWSLVNHKKLVFAIKMSHNLELAVSFKILNALVFRSVYNGNIIPRLNSHTNSLF